jgi:hypothetical protein
MPSVDSKEGYIWRILNRHGIELTPHGPIVVALSSTTVVIGKQWIAACEAAFQYEKIKYRKTDNQIVVTDD